MDSKTDPFDLVKEEVQSAIESAHSLSETLSVTPTSDLSPPLKRLRSIIESCQEDVEVLQQTNDIVSADLSRFPSITHDILSERKSFVVSVNNQIERLEHQLSTAKDRLDKYLEEQRAEAKKLESDRRQRQEAVRTGSEWLKHEDERENDEFITNMEKQRQSTIKQQEDSTLQQLGTSVRTLHDMGREIQYELDDQAYMLDDLDENMSRTRLLLDKTNKQLSKLVKHKERGRLCCICLLMVVIIVLLFNM
ncbi:hypothetical protein P9112_000133 [Eukaryota sp. TZLM1-RC]